MDFGFVVFRCVRNVDQWWAASQNTRLENSEEGINSGDIEQSKNEERHVGMWQIKKGAKLPIMRRLKRKIFKKIALR